MQARGIRAFAVALATLLASCGGGGGGSANTSSGPATAGAEAVDAEQGGSAPVAMNPRGERTGTFVDSPVAGLDWRTATRSGTTDRVGRFRYLDGETVTFSLGEMIIGSHAAAERLTPMDLARAGNEPERFAVNLARLLQTLDADGDPENGLEVPAAAGQSAGAGMSIDFGMDSLEFEADATVLGLLAAAGGVRTMLVSEARARQHFGRALAEVGEPGATQRIAGFWQHEGRLSDSDNPFHFPDYGFGYETDDAVTYHAFSEDGEWRVFESDPDAGVECFTVEHRTLTALEDARYLASSILSGGMRAIELEPHQEGVRFVEQHDDFNPTSLLMTQALDKGSPTALPLCAGASLQRPPVTSGPTAHLAGIWESEPEDGKSSYYRISSSGVAESLVPRVIFGPAPEYALQACHESVSLELAVNGDGSAGAYESVSGEAGGDRRHEFGVLALSGEALSVKPLYYGFPDPPPFSSFHRSAVDPITLQRCGANPDRHPIDEISGFWRERGSDPYSRHVHIDSRGTMTEYAPSLGGLECYVQTSSMLSSVGALDFVRSDMAGNERLLRMQPDGNYLVVADVATDGKATPVRWLQAVTGLSPDHLRLCELVVTPEDLRTIAPLAGSWSSLLSEMTGPYGFDGATVLERSRTRFWTVGSDGLSTRTTVLTELRDPGDVTAGYRSCRQSYADQVMQMQPVGADVYRVGYETWTLQREGDTLRAADSFESTAFQLDATDPSELESCSARDDASATLDAVSGVWELLPFEPGRAGALLHLESSQGHVHRPGKQGNGSCEQSVSLWLENLADARFLVSQTDLSDFSDSVVNGVVSLAIEEGALRIDVHSDDDGFSLRSGSYRRIAGLQRDAYLFTDAGCQVR